MKIDTTNLLLILLGASLVLCFVLMLVNESNHIDSVEGFDPVVDAIQDQLKNQSPDQLKDTIKSLQQRLIDYGYAPDLNKYVSKSELGLDAGKCIVAKAEDRDKYISKSDVPSPGPRIDLSQYVKKSSIPPEKVCPAAPEIDYSAYVKKSTLPPNEKCPPCIAPKVKVSAGLCRECPPPPPCPTQQPCPIVKCPEPQPCPVKECPKCNEIRYIKVPTIITKTITVDKDGNVISNRTDAISTPTPTEAESKGLLNSVYGENSVKTAALMPSTTFPNSTNGSMPNTTLAQTLARPSTCNSTFCPAPELNSVFKSTGVYGPNSV
jgi:hypothetical protein